MTVTDVQSGEVMGNYLPNPNTGRYVVILPPGRYTLLVQVPGFADINDELNIMDKASFKTEIAKEIVLKK